MMLIHCLNITVPRVGVFAKEHTEFGNIGLSEEGVVCV